ncbi:AAA family ATPase [Hymenobacter sp. RP-2-7]|uniref:AAA family ATPase n=1 Tax=Hymenobacter polaris TaxID=2682546 RepID=A0A7Y0FQ18_9BACT|nr:AAA family ATPase [Hymenobacter polaris]NML67964.1 AAA family ATPase [Hymenobacter polaris]
MTAAKSLPMQRITLDNFRVFGTPATFDLAPVTVLTGKNNSGKSSLLKAFLVLADYLEQEDQTVLRLDGRRATKHKITSYDALHNWDADYAQRVAFSFKNELISFDFTFDEHEDSTLASLAEFKATLLATNECLKFTRVERGQLLDSPLSEIEEIDFALDSKYQNRGPSYKLTVHQDFINYFGTPGIEWTPDFEDKEIAKQRESLKAELSAIEDELANAASKKLQPLGEKLQYQLLITKRQEITKRLEQVEQMRAALKKRSTTAPIESEITAGEKNYSGFTISSLVTQALFSYEEQNKKGARITKPNLTGRQVLFRLQQALDIQMRFAPFHLGANRTYQVPIIFNQYQGSELATIVAPFLEKGFFSRGRAEMFLSHWLPLFEIGDIVSVEKVEGVAFKVIVTQGKREINLVELGYGAGQVLTILLQIAAILQQREARRFVDRNLVYGPILVLIEEPEANLHPRLQSLLAQLFMEPEPYLSSTRRPTTTLRRTRINQALPFQFIIETHSEYLIRKLQLLVAQGSQPSENVLIHYMNQPSSRRITILTDGKLSEMFGPGFFDEADDSAMQLFRAQKKAARIQSPSSQL